MKGIWVWPEDAKAQAKVLRKIAQEDELAMILVALANNADGLSNAQLDRLLANNSQWRTLSHLRELTSLGFTRYQIQFFGGPGKYQLTELGESVAARMQAIR